MSKVVLITGCSTGIGRDVAQRLSQSGYTVVATARKVETLADLQVALKLRLDVTQEDSIKQAVESTIQNFGRIDVLVNNAGYALHGAIEEIPIKQIQQMYDANVFGVLRMIQAVIPHMRKQKAGRIINISSIVGRLVPPANGTYASTKFAMEGFSDALRLELVHFGIKVVLVEPGSIKTRFQTTVDTTAQAIFSNPVSPYRWLYDQYQKVTEVSRRRQEAGPEIVSKVIQQAIETSRPRARYLVGVPFSAKLVISLGDSVRDIIFKHMFKLHEAVEPQ